MRQFNKNRSRSKVKRVNNPITRLIRTIHTTLDLNSLSKECNSKSNRSIRYRVDEAVAFSNWKLVSYKIMNARVRSYKNQVTCCIAAAVMASHLSGHHYARTFYSNRGCIINPRDMYLIKMAYEAFGNKGLTNAMKKGFADTILVYDADTIIKYKRYLIDIINLVHPDTSKSTAKVSVEGSELDAITYIMKGYTSNDD